MQAALADWLCAEWGAHSVTVFGLEPLAGGAIQENWRLDLYVEGGERDGAHALVLRLDAPSALAFSHDRAGEFRLLEAARSAGVTVPEPLALCSDATVLGRPFFLMRRVEGHADPRRLTGAAHDGLDCAFGRELARLHRVLPPEPALACLGLPPVDAGRARIAELRGLLDGLPAGYPALEWGLGWLERHAPPPVPCVLCHRDFRTGNVLVADDRVSAVLDWEFAGWSDPAEDLGWVTAPCWRFRRPDLEAGGIGTRAGLLEGYAAAGGTPPDPERLAWWQVMGVARWAVIALAQAERHRSGAEPSLELALTGHLVPELALELMTLTPPE